MTHDSTPHVDHALDQWLATTGAALRDALDGVFDLDAGLTDATLTSRHQALAAGLDRVLDLDTGLHGILRAPGTGTATASHHPDDPPGSEGWFKATGSRVGDCVEVRFAGQRVQVRDSKNRSGPRLVFPRASWNRCVSHLKDHTTSTA